MNIATVNIHDVPKKFAVAYISEKYRKQGNYLFLNETSFKPIENGEVEGLIIYSGEKYQDLIAIVYGKKFDLLKEQLASENVEQHCYGNDCKKIHRDHVGF